MFGLSKRLRSIDKYYSEYQDNKYTQQNEFDARQ